MSEFTHFNRQGEAVMVDVSEKSDTAREAIAEGRICMSQECFEKVKEGSMEEFRLCNSDYRFMMLVWEHAPIGSGELVKLCAEKLGWKKSTTYTEIKRLCEKGVLQNEHAVVTPLVTQEEVQAKESDEFVERTFSGSLPGFLTAFLGNKKLSGKEAEELKKLIDEYRED